MYMNDIMVTSDDKNTKGGLLFIGQQTAPPTYTAEPLLWFRLLSPLVPLASLTELCTNLTQYSQDLPKSTLRCLSINLNKMKHVSYTNVSLTNHM